MKEKNYLTTTSVEMSRIYFLCLVVNSGVFFLANNFFPEHVVFGTSTLSPLWGLFLSMGSLSLINLLFVPVFEVYQENIKRELSPKEWMVGYFAVNFFGIWSISRFAEQFGLGVSAWWVVLLLSFVLDALQGFVIMRFAYDKK